MGNSEKDSNQLVLSDMTVGGSEDERISSVFNLTPEKVELLKKRKPRLLGIICSRSQCEEGLHCFDSGKQRLPHPAGSCQSCGIKLIEWDEVWLRDTRDADRKFEFFQKEWIRHFFFHLPITSRIEKYALRRGLRGLAAEVERQLRQGKMLRFMPALDWNQTKMLDGTIVHWARHAVGCCCRACMRYWHNVPLDHELSNADVAYFRDLAMKYIVKRMPTLPEEPTGKSPLAASVALESKTKAS